MTDDAVWNGGLEPETALRVVDEFEHDPESTGMAEPAHDLDQWTPDGAGLPRDDASVGCRTSIRSGTCLTLWEPSRPSVARATSAEWGVASHLSGVAAFGDCMRSLTEHGFVDVPRVAEVEEGRPTVGVCLCGRHVGFPWTARPARASD